MAHDALAPLDAVVAVDDGGAVAAAVASQRLGLRHNPPDAVAATRDKLVMRDAAGAAEVPQPAFAPVAGRRRSRRGGRAGRSRSVSPA